jgi:uncharacterized LabA/DUF88 family protein
MYQPRFAVLITSGIRKEALMSAIIRNHGLSNLRVMVFVDGENIAIRCKSMLDAGNHVLVPNAQRRDSIFAWNSSLTRNQIVLNGAILRTYYYTAVQGSEAKIEEIEVQLKSMGIAAPRVFKKEPNRRSKRVDITLATDMLLHATRNNYDIAVLVAGDEDYVPLVEAVQAEGRGVHVWALPDGLSPRLVNAADEYFDLSQGYLLQRTDTQPLA